MSTNQTKKLYDYAVIIGRFNPIHIGHEELINEARKNAKKIIILVGSCFKPKDIKNPFTGDERQSMITLALDEVLYHEGKTSKFLSFGQLHDYPYNDQKWAMQVQNKVDNIVDNHNEDPDSVSICLIGGKKDESSYYLDMFPQWDFIEYKFKENNNIVSASDIRDKLFTVDTNKHDVYIKPFLKEKVYRYVESCFKTDWFKTLILEYDFIKRYKESWAKAPYAPTFITTDAVVTCSGHVLMIVRKAAPGKGLKALVGGFLDQNETIIDGMIRELKEETKLKVPIPVLKGSIKEWKVFDHPGRSLRGRTVTHAAYIDLGYGELPRVKGSDDAAKAMWIPFADLKEEEIFEDHLQIINHFLGL